MISPPMPLSSSSVKEGDENDDNNNNNNNMSVDDKNARAAKEVVVEEKVEEAAAAAAADDEILCGGSSWSSLLLSRLSSSTRRKPLVLLLDGDDENANESSSSSSTSGSSKPKSRNENSKNSAGGPLSRSSSSWLSLMLRGSGSGASSSSNNHDSGGGSGGDDEEKDGADLSDSNNTCRDDRKEFVVRDASDLLWCNPQSKTTRPVWIVTTATLPWMTGTAINPLLRAAALLTRLVQEQEQQQDKQQLLQQQQQQQTEQQQQPIIVTLVLPWLETLEDRIELYGKEWSSTTHSTTRAQHEDYIRTWLRTRTQFTYAAEHLNIQWYPAVYHAPFHSILPLRDICQELLASSKLLQQQQQQQQQQPFSVQDGSVDNRRSGSHRRRRGRAVCILEEPERLTWFRQPPPQGLSKSDEEDGKSDDAVVVSATKAAPSSWHDCFEHVIGVVHTNYQAYAATAQSGGGGGGGAASASASGGASTGTSFLTLTGPILSLLSTQLVRAYCDKIIKLSPVLPTYVAAVVTSGTQSSNNSNSNNSTHDKEITCNVHGIRNEFFKKSDKVHNPFESSANDSNQEDKEANDGKDDDDYFSYDCSSDTVEEDEHDIMPNNNVDGSNSVKCYFVGKLLWAKGLDKLLELQQAYKKLFGDYFAIDIYGSGPEQDDIQHVYREYHREEYLSKKNEKRRHSLSTSTTMQDTGTCGNGTLLGSSLSSLSLAVLSTSVSVRDDDDDDDDNDDANGNDDVGCDKTHKPLPVRFLGRRDHAAISSVPVAEQQTEDKECGEYTIFVNPSVTEVLCTTTAEALAMGKFVIIPNHASNEFFTAQTKQGTGRLFVNCLAYKDTDEFCAVLDYALSHAPRPLSDEARHVLTWEAATDRLLEASVIRQPHSPSSPQEGQAQSKAERLYETQRLRSLQQEERIRTFHYDLCQAGHSLRKMFQTGQDQEGQESREVIDDHNDCNRNQLFESSVIA